MVFQRLILVVRTVKSKILYVYIYIYIYIYIKLKDFISKNKSGNGLFMIGHREGNLNISWMDYVGIRYKNEK